MKLLEIGFFLFLSPLNSDQERCKFFDWKNKESEEEELKCNRVGNKSVLQHLHFLSFQTCLSGQGSIPKLFNSILSFSKNLLPKFCSDKDF